MIQNEGEKLILQTKKTRPTNVINIPLTYAFLEKDGGGILIVFNPRSKRIVRQWSPFKNGDETFLHKDIHVVIPNLLSQGWEMKETGEYE